MSNKQLKEGIMTNQELADWFGVSLSTFNHTKKKKLEELTAFADYELVGEKVKKVKIINIYNPVYSKQGSSSFQIIKTNFQTYWKDNGKGLDTCKRVGEEMYSDGITSLSYKTTLSYVGRSKREMFGKNFISRGTEGYSIYGWGKWIQNSNHELELVPLTQEEEKIKDVLVKKYYGNVTEKAVFVQGMIDAGEITEEEAWGVLDQLVNIKDKYGAFKAEFQIAINAPLGKGTYLISDTSSVEQQSAF